MAVRKRVDISQWVETQNKDHAQSSLDRYWYNPDSPTNNNNNNNGVSPRWETSASASASAPSAPSTSSSNLPPRSPRPQSPSEFSAFHKGDTVAVRCNRDKWLPGEVKRLSNRGLRVWVSEAGMLVNVPKQLLSTHLHKIVPGEALQSLPAAHSMMETASEFSGKLLLQCVRPAHLSHRKLYVTIPSDNKSACAICGESVVVEDEAVAPWDCAHNCHIDCIQDKPKFFSTTTCPICKDASNSTSSSPTSTSPSPTTSSPSVESLRTNVIRISDEDQSISASNSTSPSTSSSSARPLPAINDTSPSSVPKVLKSAMKKQSTVSFSADGGHKGKEVEVDKDVPPPSSALPSPSARSAPSLAERMKKLSMSSMNSASATGNNMDIEEVAWVTVIQDGHNTRQTASQQRMEHMARAKENTFSAKAKQQQQQQQQRQSIK